MFAGTSIGGIMATALASGCKPQRVKQLLLDRGERIFPSKWFQGLRQTVGKALYDAEAGSFTGLTSKQIAQWAAAYPKANVTLEIERAACWLICNPKKKPKQGEGLRFINGWICRSGGGQQQQAGTAACQPKAQQQSTRASRAEAFAAGLFSTLSTAASRTEPAEVIDVDAIEIP